MTYKIVKPCDIKIEMLTAAEFRPRLVPEYNPESLLYPH
jgi:hypothetical protein